MKVITLASQKGGVGKTTTAAHLAVAASIAGRRVVLIDTDAQGSLAAWWQARASDTPSLATVPLRDISSALQRLAGDGYEIAVIDTKSDVGPAVAAAVAISDLVLIPSKPSPHDLRAVGATVETATAAGKPFAFILTQGIARTSLAVEAVAALSAHGQVAPVQLWNRASYVSSMIEGLTVTETDPKGKGAAEVTALWDWTADRLGLSKKARKKGA